MKFSIDHDTEYSLCKFSSFRDLIFIEFQEITTSLSPFTKDILQSLGLDVGKYHIAFYPHGR